MEPVSITIFMIVCSGVRVSVTLYTNCVAQQMELNLLLRLPNIGGYYIGLVYLKKSLATLECMLIGTQNNASVVDVGELRARHVVCCMCVNK